MMTEPTERAAVRTKNSNGEGSFRDRPNGSLEFRFTLDDGSRRSVYGRTKGECRKKADEVRKLHREGVQALGRTQTVEQFLRYWLDAVAKATVRPSTQERNESCVRVHIVPHLGKVRLNKLTGQQIQIVYGRLADEGLAPASVVRVHAVLHRALKMAVRWKLIASNPADDVDKPQVGRSEMQHLSKAQVEALLEHATDAVFRAFYALAATTGLRRGELLALKWSDVDFDRGTVLVQRTAQRLKGRGIVLGEPKTSAGRRSVRLGELAKRELRSLRAAQAEDRLRAGPAWSDLGLVFASVAGTPLEEARVTRTFQRDLEKAGLPKVRLHDLRHTFATLALEQGVPMKAVQGALGHAKIGTTMDVYGHLTPAMQDSVAESMDRLFGAGT